MKVSGFTYIRNGFTFGYPFIESIKSILPLCDEVVVAVGNSMDNTRIEIEKLGNKIKIIDTIWDDELRVAGKIFSQQTNIALAACTGDWLMHIQADEVVHENDLQLIKNAMLDYEKDEKVEGLLFQFLNFYGNYFTINQTRKTHKKEIRIVRNGKNILSYKDSQGFRKYSSEAAYNQGEAGEKLKVKELDARIFHYNYVRNEEAGITKAKYFDRFWHTDENINKRYETKPDRYNIERIKKFEGTHPAVMKEIITAFKNDFDAEKVRGLKGFKQKLTYGLEDLLGFKIGEYKNYKKI